MPLVADVIKIIEFWLRLATFLHHPLKSALLFVLHNTGKRTDYVGLRENELDLYNELNRNIGKINHLLKKGILKQDQVDILLPPGTNKTDSSTFDVTLIIVLITNFTTLPPPKNGWKGKFDPTDLSTAAFVIHARKWRNVFIHGTEPKSLCKSDFDRIWLEGENIVKGLGLTTIDTKALKSINLDTRNSFVSNSLFTYIKKIQGTLDTHDKQLAITQGDLVNAKNDITSINASLVVVKSDLDNVKSDVGNIKYNACEVFNNKERIQAIEEKLSEYTRHQGNFKEY